MCGYNKVIPADEACMTRMQRTDSAEGRDADPIPGIPSRAGVRPRPVRAEASWGGRGCRAACGRGVCGV